MTAIRTSKQDHFTVVSNHYLRDKNLSWAAKGFLTYLLSLPQNWTFTLKHFVQTSKNGKASTRTILRELQQAGYLELKQTRDKKGYPITFFIAYELPQKQHMENPNLKIGIREPESENRPLQNTKGPNTEKQNIDQDLSQEKREKINKREKKEGEKKLDEFPSTSSGNGKEGSPTKLDFRMLGFLRQPNLHLL